MARNAHRLLHIHQLFITLEAAMGTQHWWPAESSFEVVVGAYLTQNTAWGNVELAMANLRRANALSINGIRAIGLAELEQLVRPAGYFRQKAVRLKRFVEHLDQQHGGRLERLFATPAAQLREELLALPGIGPETADSILLYAACKEVFVVDSYTRRIFERHQLSTAASRYDEIRMAVEAALAVESHPLSQVVSSRAQRGTPAISNSLPQPALPPAFVVHSPSAASRMPRSELARRYAEFHALLVQTAKHFCLKREPHCEGCPLRPLLPRSRR